MGIPDRQRRTAQRHNNNICPAQRQLEGQELIIRTISPECSFAVLSDLRLQRGGPYDVEKYNQREKPEKGIHLDDFSFLEQTRKYAKASETASEDIRRYLCNLLLVYKDYHREVEENMFEYSLMTLVAMHT